MKRLFAVSWIAIGVTLFIWLVKSKKDEEGFDLPTTPFSWFTLLSTVVATWPLALIEAAIEVREEAHARQRVVATLTHLREQIESAMMQIEMAKVRAQQDAEGVSHGE